MKKSDLKNGMIVKLRDDSLMMVVDNRLVEVTVNLNLNNYSDTLEYYSTTKYDIVAIYVQVREGGFIFADLTDRNYKYLDLIWKRVKVELTEDMKTLLRLLPRSEYDYLTRNDTSQGMIKLHTARTVRPKLASNGVWTSDLEYTLGVYSHIFDTLPKGVCIKISDYI